MAAQGQRCLPDCARPVDADQQEEIVIGAGTRLRRNPTLVFLSAPRWPEVLIGRGMLSLWISPAGEKLQSTFTFVIEGFHLNRVTATFVLIVAAGLEAIGDAIVRVGLHSHSTWQRAALFAVGAAVLFSYGWTVNAPPWVFGRLLGLYVVFFFVIAQIISWLAFKQRPSLAVMLGGCLIVAGGIVIAVANR